MADALSQGDHDRITDLAPQLMNPGSSLQNCGFLTYSNLASPAKLLTIFGEDLHHLQDEIMILPARASHFSVPSPVTITEMVPTSQPKQFGLSNGCAH